MRSVHKGLIEVAGSGVGSNGEIEPRGARMNDEDEGPRRGAKNAEKN